MFRKAYQFVLDILHDALLDDYIFSKTGKHLAIINAGAKVSAPAAQISFEHANPSRRSNTASEVIFNVDFSLPFWGNDAFISCIDFLDFVIPLCFEYKEHDAFVLNITPAISEPDELNSQIWRVALAISFSILS